MWNPRCRHCARAPNLAPCARVTPLSLVTTQRAVIVERLGDSAFWLCREHKPACGPRCARRESSPPRNGGGMSLIDVSQERQTNPLDVVEHLAAIKEWAFDRSGDDEIAISITGRWTDYHLSFTWMDELE